MDTVDSKVEQQLAERTARMRDWIRRFGQGCQQKQAHLEPGSPERIYWHYGYLSALQEVERLLNGEIDRLE